MAKIKFPSIIENKDLKNEFSYPEELELNTNKPLFIGVQGPYEFIVLDEKTYIISTKYKEKLINGDNQEEDVFERFLSISHSYNPFEKFDIEHFINTVMSINLKDTKSILDFYNTFGTIGYDGSGTNQGTLNSSTIRQFGMNLYTSNESLAYFSREITMLQHCIQLFEAIQNEDDEFLRDFELLAKYAFASKEVIDKTTPKEQLFLLAKRSLLFAINKRSDLMHPVIYLSPEGELIKGTTASCLLGVFYLRLYELVTDNPKMKKCRYCRNYFIPRKTNANFCPPPEANEKSKCANRYDAMVRRIAEWHFKEDLTLEEIQEKLTKPFSRSIKEIQFILDNYKGKLKK